MPAVTPAEKEALLATWGSALDRTVPLLLFLELGKVAPVKIAEVGGALAVGEIEDAIKAAGTDEAPNTESCFIAACDRVT